MLITPGCFYSYLRLFLLRHLDARRTVRNSCFVKLSLVFPLEHWLGIMQFYFFADVAFCKDQSINACPEPPAWRWNASSRQQATHNPAPEQDCTAVASLCGVFFKTTPTSVCNEWMSCDHQNLCFFL